MTAAELAHDSGSAAARAQASPTNHEVQRALNEAFGHRYVLDGESLESHRTSGRLTYGVTDQSSGKPWILHVHPLTDVLLRDRDIGEEIGPPASRHLVEQSVRIVAIPGHPEKFALALRRRVDTILADTTDLNQFFGVSTAKDALEVRLQVLEDILTALEELHKKKAFHGDLRPENVSLLRDAEDSLKGAGSALVDYAFRVPPDLSDDQRAFVTRDGVAENPSPAGDVYSFGRLAQRMLGAYLWDNRDLDPHYASLRTSGFEWILDYCTNVPGPDRPSVPALLDVLFGEGKAVRREAEYRLDEAVPAVVSQIMRLARSPGASGTRLIEAIVATATLQVRNLAGSRPETRLALLPPGRTERLVRRLAIDLIEYVEPRLWGRRPTPLDTAHIVDTSRLAPVIDNAWRDRLHRAHFGFTIDLDHEGRMAAAEARGESLPGRPEYKAHVEAMNQVRAQLIHQHSFVYTEEAARLMSAIGRTAAVDDVSEADVTVLRRWGVVLAVPDDGRWLYPMFQFDPRTGLPSPHILRVNTLMAERDHEWNVLAWWSTPRTALDGRTLSAVVHHKRAGRSIRDAIDGLTA